MSGAAALERNDNATAAALWKRLRATLPADSPNLAEIDQVMARVGVAPPPRGPQRQPPSPAPVPRRPWPRRPRRLRPPRQAAPCRIDGRVEIDPKLAAKMAPGDTLFIYARNPEGSRMPLAARSTAADLPKSFALTDAMAMTPAKTISQAKSDRRRGAHLQGGQRDAAARRPRGHQRARGAGRARRPRDDRPRRPLTPDIYFLI